jgi:glycosyltransferase involved in cell wall biosynthesis
MVILNTTPLALDSRVRKEGQALVVAGHSVRLVGVRQRGERVRDDLGGFEVVAFEVWSRRLPRTPLFWPLKYAEFLVKSVAALLGSRAEVYHAHDLEALIPAWIAARLTRGRVIYDSHELFTERPIEMRAVWRAIEHFLIRRVDAVIAASEERAVIMRDEYGARDLPAVIANCPPRVGRHAESTVRDRLPVERRGARLVLYQGGLSPGRGLETLTRAVGLFEPSAVLVFVGAASAYSESVLRSVVEAQGLRDRVFFVAPVDATEVVSFIRTADLGVVIYQNTCRNNYYCAPNKVYDYCMAGLPVVGSDFPPLRTLVQRYAIGVLFDPEKPAAIAAAVNQVLTDDDVHERAVAGSRAVAARCNWEEESKKLVGLYERLRGASARMAGG